MIIEKQEGNAAYIVAIIPWLSYWVIYLIGNSKDDICFWRLFRGFTKTSVRIFLASSFQFSRAGFRLFYSIKPLHFNNAPISILILSSFMICMLLLLIFILAKLSVSFFKDRIFTYALKIGVSYFSKNLKNKNIESIHCHDIF